MGLIVYECGRPDHGHEIRQWTAIKQSLYDYYQGRDELALLIISYNVSDVALDGLLLKEDAVILMELKDRSGTMTARQNGEWECDDDPMHPIIHGGSGKTVFEQLRVNRRTLSMALRDNGFLPEPKTKDIQGLVVVTRLDRLKTDFDRETKAWVHVTDVEMIGAAMHDIKCRPFRDPVSGCVTPVHFGPKDIFNFIRKIKLDERALVMEWSDAHLLPDDLFHPDSPHNGESFSPGTVLANNVKQIGAWTVQLDELKKTIDALQSDPDALADPEWSKALLEAKKNVAEKDAEGATLRVRLAEQEIQMLEARFRREEKRNAPDEEQLELLQKIDEKKAELDALRSQENAKKAGLARAMEELKQAMTVADTSKEEAIDERDGKTSGTLNASEGSSTKPDVHREEKGHDPTDSLQQDKPEPPSKVFDIKKESMDDDQLDLIERTNDANMLVTGPAGCGKSLIAVHKARQLISIGEDVILIAFTKSLKAFMQHGNDSDARFFYHWQWEKNGRPSADYIIVDEIQDFTHEEIMDFVEAAKKHYFFFGDTAQSIMTMDDRQPLSIEKIADLLKLTPLRLYSNYRLPRAVARITQDFVGIGVPKYSEKIYKSKEKALPHIIGYASQEDEMEGMLRIMQKHGFAHIGILVSDNDSVLSIKEWLRNNGIETEHKWNSNEDWRNANTLDFRTSRPKIMTYHSAKGLQFQTVIIPSYQGAAEETSRKALYVAMTRTFRDLYVLHHEKELAKPLADVPGHLYLAKEEG
ncbi:MAG: ATP-binding domain-containing protein [Mailhella sp.]|nr:ATP-binding domain-containing protein [Mailhella sp.]